MSCVSASGDRRESFVENKIYKVRLEHDLCCEIKNETVRAICNHRHRILQRTIGVFCGDTE